ncbi:glutamine--fructose-6-phosphate transaminase (isomerizing) [Gracilinema caldarium]|uniref:Glutamine--fructose-6-phosphate aminotransferase [isomerizing] n=1 Tax=Gracilinema caldarium (strain ATCC 51460 / DSM 7334 / H1) TaxID=744872 RepID=F8EZF2_GRAC1|nr:glutamine--fructose-6-phosphate transaminase (isomerizing) [Gracilinema caldarium]AEJ20175.1 Glucosamine--fructose-6-phosphate aminotransferase (isomerizing) [Gracilinema caldarium DSM 7334]
MCGIVGYCGPKSVTPILLDGLKRLEYRGYDSAGIAVEGSDAIKVIKRTGKIQDLRAIVSVNLEGHCGIGHTRWATHGGVTDINAHPHLDASGKIAVVHNGIIENYTALKASLEKQGVHFVSETDSEVLPHLIAYYYQGDLEKAVRQALRQVKGTYGIAVIHLDEPGRIVGARYGSPLVIGVGDGEMLLASDVTAMIAHTKQVVYLEDGELVSLTKDTYTITDLNDQQVDKQVDEIQWDLEAIEKEGFACFMEKEIFEQPESIARTLSGRLDLEYATGKLGGLNMTSRELLAVKRIKIVAAGTSWHAGLVGAYLIETLARIPASAELSSELRYRNSVVEPDTIYFAVTQSGETADTLYAMRELKRKGARVLGICNVVGSTIARESDGGVYTHAGPEIAVASTKAFTSQLAVFYVFALLMARMRDMSVSAGQRFVKELQGIPEKVREVLKQRDHIQALAKKYYKARDFLFLGRGLEYPVALEGALKLKEISYIHAEGYSAGEIKHGPIALVNEETPSVFLVPRDYLREKVISNMKEIKARKGPIIALCTEGDAEVAAIADDIIPVPAVDELFYPFILIIPLQLFAYFCALELGRDVDQPRNLAKSVTVE